MHGLREARINFSAVKKEDGSFERFLVSGAGSIFGNRAFDSEWVPEASGNACWSLATIDPSTNPVLKREKTLRIAEGAGVVAEDRQISEADGTLKARTETRTKTFPFGEREISKQQFIITPAGVATGSRTSTMTYIETSTANGYGNLLESYNDYDGQWAYYTFLP